MGRLTSDRSVAPVAAQFVLLKIDTQSDEWQTWARKHSSPGGAIPIIFVVRADGEKLYGESGSKQGPELPLFLRQQLASAGTILSDQQVATIKSALDDAHEAIGDGDSAAAVRRLESLRKIGPPGKLGSYATVALEADSLYAKLIEEGREALVAAQQQLEGDEPFAGVLGVIAANRTYGAMPDLKKDLGSAERDLSRNPQHKDLVAPAQSLDRALALVGQKNAQARRSGTTMLGAVVTRYPGTPAAAMAEAKLAELGVEVAAAQVAAQSGDAESPSSRTWTDATGQFRVEAELLAVADGKVQLKKSDGSVVSVPLEKLSQADRDFLTRSAGR